MAGIRSRCAKVLAAAACAAATVPAPGAVRGEPLRDAPVVWYAGDRNHLAEMPQERDPNLLWDGPRATLKRPVGRLLDPVRLVRRVGTVFGGDHVPAAADVNALDEVPNCAWFTNRIGLFPCTPEEAARGPGSAAGPDVSGPWTVTRAKSEGVTPGFNIRDAAGADFLVKFDPLGLPGIATAAAVISGLILHNAGYFVPADVIVFFRREDLRLGDGVLFTDPGGSVRPMREADLDSILARVDRRPDGTYRAVSSRFLQGTPIGPFDYKGTRDDDPNDRIPHQDRRELRGLRMFAAWINHFDTKQHNSLDMVVEEDGRRYVRHHLIDFASTLGTGAFGPGRTQGWEHTVDAPAIIGRTLALGLHEDAWRRLERPEGLPEIGFFESELFAPLEFKPLVPNSAFANMTDRDGYWAAKIISAFRDDHLTAIVERGRYEDPRAAVHMAQVLGERRDEIARLFFDRIPPLEYFELGAGTLVFRDLGEERGIYPGTTPVYEIRFAAVDAERNAAGWSPWRRSSVPRMEGVAADTPAGVRPFLAVECRVDRGSGFGPAVRAYFSRSTGRIVGVDR